MAHRAAKKPKPKRPLKSVVNLNDGLVSHIGPDLVLNIDPVAYSLSFHGFEVDLSRPGNNTKSPAPTDDALLTGLAAVRLTKRPHFLRLLGKEWRLFCGKNVLLGDWCFPETDYSLGCGARSFSFSYYNGTTVRIEYVQIPT